MKTEKRTNTFKRPFDLLVLWWNTRKRKKLIVSLRAQLLGFGCDTSDMTDDEVEQHVINVGVKMSKCGISAKEAAEGLSAIGHCFAVNKITYGEQDISK